MVFVEYKVSEYEEIRVSDTFTVWKILRHDDPPHHPGCLPERPLPNCGRP